VRLRLDSRGRKVTGASVLAASRKEFDEPTLGVVVDQRFYFVANSQWSRFDAQHKLPPADQLRRPLVLWLDLEEKAPPAPPARPAPQRSPTLPCVPPLC